MDNSIYIPFLSPVKFYQKNLTASSKYFTKFLDDYPLQQRIYKWQEAHNFIDVWQTTDTIKLQFESTFDPIVMDVIKEDGSIYLSSIALISLPNKFIPNAYAFELTLSLAGFPTGCYKLRLTLGSGGNQVIMESSCQYVSSVQIANTILIDYYNSRYHADVIFETGIKFQKRMYGYFSLLNPGRKDDRYIDQRYNPRLINSIPTALYDIIFGSKYGCPDDEVKLLNFIWSCDNVSVDDRPFCISDGGKFDFIEAENYARRGVKLTVEEGINRNSKIITIGTDTNKRLLVTAMVDQKMFGDTSNQGSSNAVPIQRVE